MRKHRAVIAAVFTALVVAAAAVAASAASTITINLQGGAGSRTFKACGALHHYTVYRVGTRIQIDGVVSPRPASFRVKLKVKQCVRGTFRTVWSAGAHERSDGTYTGVFVARRRGAFFARAYLHIGARTVRSDKTHFQVR
jgi:hypothetical protein